MLEALEGFLFEVLFVILRFIEAQIVVAELGYRGMIKAQNSFSHVRTVWILLYPAPARKIETNGQQAPKANISL